MTNAAGLLKKSGVADHFTIVANDAARDRRLSLKARGLLLYLLSHKDGWTLSIDRLARQMDEGKAAIRGAVQELETVGYLTREQTRGQDGQTSHSVWLVTDSPPSVSPSAENRTTENRTTLEEHPLEDDHLEDQTLPNTSGTASDVVCEDDGDLSEPSVAKVAEALWAEAEDLCGHLAVAIVESGGEGTRAPKVTRAWIREMERLLRIDGRTPAQVRAAIDWAHRGQGAHGDGDRWDGWSRVVLSPVKLRKHYEMMRRQAAPHTRRTPSGGPLTASEALQRHLARQEGATP